MGYGGTDVSHPALKLDIIKQKHTRHFANTFLSQQFNIMTVYTPTALLNHLKRSQI